MLIEAFKKIIPKLLWGTWKVQHTCIRVHIDRDQWRTEGLQWFPGDCASMTCMHTRSSPQPISANILSQTVGETKRNRKNRNIVKIMLMAHDIYNTSLVASYSDKVYACEVHPKTHSSRHSTTSTVQVKKIVFFLVFSVFFSMLLNCLFLRCSMILRDEEFMLGVI